MRFGRYRTVAFDGCTSVKVPDSKPNRAWLGKMKAALGVTGYPAVELMTLVETGTRALIGAVFGPPATGETDYARQLLHLLTRDMLVLTDRGFDAAAFLEAVAATRARFLARLTSTRKLPVMARLDDGTFLSRIGKLTVRVIEAEVIVTLADGTRYCGRYRLATTLLNPRRYPAPALIRLYHEDGSTRSPTSRCATPCSTAGYCARRRRPGWNRKSGRCWPSTRRCAGKWSPPSRPSPAPIPTGPASPPPWRPRRKPSPPPAAWSAPAPA